MRAQRPLEISYGSNIQIQGEMIWAPNFVFLMCHQKIQSANEESKF